MKIFSRALIALIASSGLLIGIHGAGTGNAFAQSFAFGTCTGGNIAPGSYGTLTVSGNCRIPTGVVAVRSNLIIAPGGALEAAVPGTTVTVGQNVYAFSGSALDLGCASDNGCATNPTRDFVGGSIVANSAVGVLLHGDFISGSVTVTNGGGGAVCGYSPFFGGPVFSDVEDSIIVGNVNISGLQTCWVGLFRNVIGGSTTMNNNISADPDSTEVATNLIEGNLACANNVPAPQVGDSGGAPNTVLGTKSGQCTNV